MSLRLVAAVQRVIAAAGGLLKRHSGGRCF